MFFLLFGISYRNNRELDHERDKPSFFVVPRFKVVDLFFEFLFIKSPR